MLRYINIRIFQQLSCIVLLIDISMLMLIDIIVDFVYRYYRCLLLINIIVDFVYQYHRCLLLIDISVVVVYLLP